MQDFRDVVSLSALRSIDSAIELNMADKVVAEVFNDAQVWQAWQDSAPLCPQLYLCSSDDALIPPSAINSFKDQQVLFETL